MKKQITMAVFPEFMDEKKNQNKWFTSVSVHELMEYPMVWCVKITEPIEDQAKLELREDYDPILPISKFFKRIEYAMQLADDAKFAW